jgi:hypothetical protein
MLLSFVDDANFERVEGITGAGSPNLVSCMSPFKEYRYITAICGRPLLDK